MTSRSAPRSLSVRTQARRHPFRSAVFSGWPIKIIFALAFAVVMFAFTGAAHAQNQGEINGTVADPTGAVIPRATVSITEVSTGETHTAQTNAAGFFDFTGLVNGRYNLTASTSGFATYKKNNIILNIAQVLREDVPMKAGNAGETVTVEAAALQVQTETNEMSTSSPASRWSSLRPTAATWCLSPRSAPASPAQFRASMASPPRARASISASTACGRTITTG